MTFCPALRTSSFIGTVASLTPFMGAAATAAALQNAAALPMVAR